MALRTVGGGFAFAQAYNEIRKEQFHVLLRRMRILQTGWWALANSVYASLL